MLYRSDTKIITILLSVYEHMQRDYDFLLVVAGDTGDGKSHFVLNLFETWYKVILGKPVTTSMIEQISQNYRGWLKTYKKIGPYDMNIFDESSRDLNSRDFMRKISKDLTKLFDVFRCRRYFSVVVLPNYFRLNKALREDRLRGLVWINKRGNYKWFTKTGIRYLNAFNERRMYKRMDLARPFHLAMCPKYTGILKDLYQQRKDEGVEEVLDEAIESLEDTKKKPALLVDQFKDDVAELRKEKMTAREISDQLGIGLGTVGRCIAALKAEDKA